jgi:hypothetical protein
MEYVFALATLVVVFIIPAFIVAALVGAPERSRRTVARSASDAVERPADHSV